MPLNPLDWAGLGQPNSQILGRKQYWRMPGHSAPADNIVSAGLIACLFGPGLVLSMLCAGADRLATLRQRTAPISGRIGPQSAGEHAAFQATVWFSGVYSLQALFCWPAPGQSRSSSTAVLQPLGA